MEGIREQFEREFRLWRRPLHRKLLQAPLRVVRTRLVAQLARRLPRPLELETPTFWGGRMRIVLPEGVSHALYYNRFLEAGLTRFMLERLRPGMVFLDVGAHFGYFSLLASELVGRQGAVHAFEPTPDTFQRLGANTSARPNVRIHRLALWSERTELDFHDYGLEFSGLNSFTELRLPAARRPKTRISSSLHRVRAVPLDAFLHERGLRPNLVKIDAESAELKVLEGMTETLAGPRPLLSVEVGDLEVAAAPASRELIAFLAARGYRALEFTGSGFEPHEPRESYPPGNLFFVPEG